MSDFRQVLTRLGARVSASADAFERLDRRRRRRQRNRRIAAAVVGAVMALAGVGVAVVAFRSEVTTRPAGAEDDVVALWPEHTLAEIRAVQEAVVSGDQSLAWRLDGEATGKRFADEVLGWGSGVATTVQLVPGDIDIAVVDVVRPAIPCPSPVEGSIDPRCPSRHARLVVQGLTGPNGVWSVLRVESDRIGIDPETGAGVSSDQTFRARVDAQRGAQAVGGVTLFGDGCQAVFSGERLTESGTIELAMPGYSCAVRSGYLFVYTVGPGSSAFDPDPTDREELFAPDPFGQPVELLDLAAFPVAVAGPERGLPPDPYPRGVFGWCPDIEGMLSFGQDAEDEAARAALRFADAFLTRDEVVVGELLDQSVPRRASWAIAGTPDGISVLGSMAGGGSLVEHGCGPEVAARTVTVTIDDGTDSASLDFTLFLVLRSDGWNVWGSY